MIRTLVFAAAAVVFATGSVTAVAQSTKAREESKVCVACTTMCGQCGMGAKCRETCNSNGNPRVTGACKNWFDACPKK
jgi:hypothetical protein